MSNVKASFYQHSIWSDNNEWIESDRETFNDEVIEHRNLYIQRRVFEDNKTIYYYDNKMNSSYDWKVVFEL